nr:hypothetical protein [Ktedonobacterales bacterium]
MADETTLPSEVIDTTPTNPPVDYAAIAAGGIGGKLGRFKGGVGATRTDTMAATNVAGEGPQTANLPTVNGKPVGTWRNGALWMPLAQLRLAPAEDLLCSRYRPGDSDPYYVQRKEALAHAGDRIPTLPIALANQSVIVQGEECPLFLVLDRPEVYYALTDMKRTEAKVEFAPADRAGGVLLRALGDSEQGVMRARPSILEICHAVKRLRECGFTFPEIAMYMAKNTEDGVRPSDSTLGAYVSVAELPERVQDLLHRGIILWTHARDIAGKFSSDPVLCERFALLASQNGQKTTRAVGEALKRVEEGLTTLVEQDGMVTEVPRQPGLHLVPTAKGGKPPTVPTYSGTMSVKPIVIQQESARYQVSVSPTDRT